MKKILTSFIYYKINTLFVICSLFIKLSQAKEALHLSSKILLENNQSRQVIAQNTKLKSRILKKDQHISDVKEGGVTEDIYDKNKKKAVEKNKATKKTKKVLKEKIIKNAKQNNKILQKDNKLFVYFLQNKSSLEDTSTYLFEKKLLEIENVKEIIVEAFASKTENNNSSSARRLSLSRALSIRSILMKNNYKKTIIKIRALGTESSNLDSQDVAIISFK